MTRIIADISASLDGFVTGPDPGPDNGLGTAARPCPPGRSPATPTGGAPRRLVQRSVIPASTATHLTYDVFR